METVARAERLRAGFAALEEDSEVIYKVSVSYSPQYERAVRSVDQAIGIEWLVGGATLIVSDKDRSAPPLAEVDTGF